MSKAKRILIRIGIVLGAVLLAVLIFLAVFYVSDGDAEVIGSSRYTATEVRRMVLTDFKHRNSLYLGYFEKTVEPQDAPFIVSIDIETMGAGKVRLHVNENAPVGYIVQDGLAYYFDGDGIVLEAISDFDQVSVSAGEAVQASSYEIIAEPVEEDTEEVVSSSGEEREALQAVMERSSDTSYHPALTDIPMVYGLPEQVVKVGAKVEAEDPSIFRSIQALTKILNKFGITIDYLEIRGGSQIDLHIGGVTVYLGKDTLMEDKMSRVAEILPQLKAEGLSGVLHMENWTQETINIVFDKDETSQESSEETAEESGEYTEDYGEAAGGEAYAENGGGYTEEYAEGYTEEYAGDYYGEDTGEYGGDYG